MQIWRSIWFGSVFSCLIFPIQAQNVTSGWFRGTVSNTLHKKISIENEFQHRRQNGLNNQNPFDRNSLLSYRSWIHFHTNDMVKLSFSPFAFFSSYSYANDALETSSKHSEYRFSFAIELQKKLVVKNTLSNRTALEYRLIENAKVHSIRFRNKVGYRYAFSDKLHVQISEEVFLNLPTKNLPRLDQNRIGISCAYFVTPTIKMELGYTYLKRITSVNSGENFQSENNFMLYFNYELKRL